MGAMSDLPIIVNKSSESHTDSPDLGMITQMSCLVSNMVLTQGYGYYFRYSR